MAFKRKVTADEFAAMSAEHQSLYKPLGADYVIDIEPGEDVAPLKRARDHERKRADDAEAKLAEATTHVEELEEQIAKGAQPVQQELEAKHKKAIDKLNADSATKVARLEKQLKTILVDSKAQELAASISDDPELLVGFIAKRLQADISGDEPMTVILDDGGSISSMTLEQLGQEFVANPKYARIVRGSSASGSGARPGTGRSGAPSRKALKDMNEAERVAFATDDPQGFEKETKAQKEAERDRRGAS